jgi:hypothetical protein
LGAIALELVHGGSGLHMTIGCCQQGLTVAADSLLLGHLPHGQQDTHTEGAAVAAAEAAVGLAIVLTIYRNRDTVDMEQFNLLKW